MKKYLFPALLAFAGLNTLGSFSSATSRLFGFGLLAWAAWLLIKAIKGPGKPTADNSLRDRLSGFHYNHFHEKSGIALDSSRQEVHLISNGAYKVYPFGHIRSWETNIATGGMIRSSPSVTAGMVAVAENLRQQRENRANTGLFIQVRDVDHPKWHIEFPARDVQRQLERWMEILRQEVNEAA
jgi:hypothetical protein